jgi:hypothetical protein
LSIFVSTSLVAFLVVFTPIRDGPAVAPTDKGSSASSCRSNPTIIAILLSMSAKSLNRSWTGSKDFLTIDSTVSLAIRACSGATGWDEGRVWTKVSFDDFCSSLI